MTFISQGLLGLAFHESYNNGDSSSRVQLAFWFAVHLNGTSPHSSCPPNMSSVKISFCSGGYS